MNQGKVVVAGTVVRAPMLINCDLGPSFHICCNDVLADQHNGRYSWIPRLPTDLCYYSRIWKSYPGATLHVAFYFTLLSLCLCPGASLPVVVGRANFEGEEESDVHEPGTRAESNARFAYIHIHAHVL